jgi:hypothetical protein
MMKEAIVYTALAVIFICLGVALSIFLLGGVLTCSFNPVYWDSDSRKFIAFWIFVVALSVYTAVVEAR